MLNTVYLDKAIPKNGHSKNSLTMNKNKSTFLFCIRKDTQIQS